MKKILSLLTSFTILFSLSSGLISCNVSSSSKTPTSPELFDEVVNDATNDIKTYLDNGQGDMEGILGSNYSTDQFSQVYSAINNGKIDEQNYSDVYNFLYKNYDSFISLINQNLIKEYQNLYSSSSVPLKISSIKEFDFTPYNKNDLDINFNAVTITFSASLNITLNELSTNITSQTYSFILTDNPKNYIKYMKNATKNLVLWLNQFDSSIQNILKISDKSNSNILQNYYSEFYVNLSDKTKNQAFDDVFISLFKQFVPNGETENIENLLKNNSFTINGSVPIFDINNNLSIDSNKKYGNALEQATGVSNLITNIEKNTTNEYIDSLMSDDLYNNGVDYTFGSTRINLADFSLYNNSLNGYLKSSQTGKDELFQIGMSKSDFDSRISNFNSELNDFYNCFKIFFDNNYTFGINGQNLPSYDIIFLFSPFYKIINEVITYFYSVYPNDKPTNTKAGFSFAIGSMIKNLPITSIFNWIHSSERGYFYEKASINYDMNVYLSFSFGTINFQYLSQKSQTFAIMAGVPQNTKAYFNILTVPL